ncbi:MAG: 2-oxoacid:acceptor oxidoreductase subunit alpha [Bacillota bacterium]|nr:2-oxoacid:acceptor oxidoreductase subunit alpha [Bacillota bacterium]MDD3299178.1 2-oxoacid:acceptor oxidoreductase subunit alpha [Bacillota bacterium]MDD3850873.1 2-oxoacid:acceptor oxidoreductase subunit alpha [Bacillota bacterium]MDD4707830.1 2-oxoacid:acceptor oxidoreductase subunit alpha [Bacillota bacterium]
MTNNQAKLMQGNEACLEGAIAAGMRFFAGYPITPSTEIAEGASERLPMVGGKFIQMEDEIGSMAAVIGASLAGLKAMTATSGPGMSLKLENIGYASLTEIPCVIVNVQRGGPSTGLPTSPAQADIMQARWGAHGDHPSIVLYPASVSEAYSVTVTAFNLAEKYRMPVILLMDEVMGHMRERVVLPDAKDLQIVNREKASVPPEEYLPYKADPDGGVPEMPAFGEGYRYHVTGLIHSENGFPTTDAKKTATLLNRLMKKIDNNLDDIVKYQEDSLDDAKIVLIAYGSTARSAKSAMDMAREQGIPVGLFRPITIWPFAEDKVKEIAGKAEKIIVPEMNLGQYRSEIERAVAGKCEVIGINRADGEIITPEDIYEKIKGVL